MEHQHFMLHKPHGYLSQFVYELKRKKKLLGELYPFPEGTMAIGRLDEDSEGLLLLTTDGKVSEQVRRKTVEKEYYAQVDGIITQEAVEKLQKGVEIGVNGTKYLTRNCSAKLIIDLPNYIGPGRRIRDDRHGPTSWVSITVTEGKFRQVRKMTAAVGFPTLRLIRIRVGENYLEGLNVGDVKKVNVFPL
ncbi:pseudouridine synthase [Flavobacterium sp. 316]|uniref:Pseudouridine synthase n=1 Tax=Flavobacterium sediminilitoris TaxID=2024526 RepID=A0ABY4HIH2_9FLAO|nr:MULTISPECIES: pseudouridine synthase [Flavobacterium]KIX22186.1 pseudouridine synthase [Flavobacterium sp. 316]UOX32508.1 pseudouridine synthase [Flavobacterium sediminilitoris]